MISVLRKTYEGFPVNEKEVLRYYGAKEREFSEEQASFCREAERVFVFEVIYAVVPVKISDEKIDFSAFKVKSKNLADNLSGSSEAVIFLATVGGGIDRLIKKYSLISPVKSLFFQALGAERVETLCDAFVNDLKKEYALKPRFSAGFGDLKLETQKDIFDLLTPDKIGVTLGENLIMSPSKSVTAFVGITEKKK